MGFYVLYESAAGFSLFEPVQLEEIETLSDKVQKSLSDFKRLAKVIKLRAFQPFGTPEKALACQNDISEGILNDFLRAFLEQNLPKHGSHTLGVGDKGLQAAIGESTGYSCVANSTVQEIVRAVRSHFELYHKSVTEEEAQFLFKAQRSLAHSYSRGKVKFNVHKADNMIIQSISTLDQLDKDVNTFAMRVREWYSWHFPELVKIVSDNIQYARLAKFIGNKSALGDDAKTLEELNKLTNDENQSKLIISAAKSSMGYDISEFDLRLVNKFAARVVSLAEFRAGLSVYLKTKMNAVAPNLSALIGDVVGARLINHAGSLTTLAKYPASTVQILGAEKALFRALKTRSPTPKYGLIFNSSYIGKAKTKDKGRISRYLANKCSIASRLDAFSDKPTNKYGLCLAQQVEDRLKFFETGVAPAKNIDVMHEVLTALQDEPSDEEPVEEMNTEVVEEVIESKPKREKHKKRKSEKRRTKDKA